MRHLRAEGMTMLLATHEMGFAREVADRICFMDGGRILEQGPPAADIHRAEKTAHAGLSQSGVAIGSG